MTHETAELLALADLGQKVVNAVLTSDRLGHTRLQHSVRYYHSAGDPTVDFIKVVLEGKTDDALAAYETWRHAAVSQFEGTSPERITA